MLNLIYKKNLNEGYSDKYSKSNNTFTINIKIEFQQQNSSQKNKITKIPVKISNKMAIFFITIF